MAVIGSFSKQPRETIPVDVDYSDVIGSGRTASLIAPTIEAPAGMTLVSSIVSGTTAQLYITGGTAGASYCWTLLTDLTIGGKVTRVEDEFHVTVQDVTSDTRDLTGDAYEADAEATAPGSAAPVLPKRAGDARPYVIDFRPLLRRGEVLASVTGITADAGLTVGVSSVINGQFLEVLLSGGTVPDTQPSKDYVVRAMLATSRGAVQANLTMRVFP